MLVNERSIGNGYIYDPESHTVSLGTRTVRHRPGESLKKEVPGRLDGVLAWLPFKGKEDVLSASFIRDFPGKPAIYDVPASSSSWENLARDWGTDTHSVKSVFFAFRQKGIKSIPTDPGKIYVCLTTLPSQLSVADMRHDHGRLPGTSVYLPEKKQWHALVGGGINCTLSLNPFLRCNTEIDGAGSNTTAPGTVKASLPLSEVLKQGAKIFTDTGASTPGAVWIKLPEGRQLDFDAVF